MSQLGARLLLGFGVELLIIVVGDSNVRAEADNPDGVGDDMGLCIRGQP